MSDDTVRAHLPTLALADPQPAVTHNEALVQLDALLYARLLDRDLSTPPATPADGDTYLIKASGTGLWLGQDGKLAYALDGAWRFFAPFTGLSAYVVDEAKLIVFTGSAWADYATILSLQNLPLLGVNATADTTNKLAVKSSALLFDNIGGTVQAKLNKHATGDTASLLYQTTYAGRAEVGLTGDDDFHFKVSADGSTWTDAIHIAAANGWVGINAAPLKPLHVNQGATVPASILLGSGDRALFTAEAGSALALLCASDTGRYGITGRRARGTLATPTAVVNGDSLMYFLAGGYNGATLPVTGSIEFFCDGTPISGSSTPTRLELSTGSTSRSPRLRLGSEGNVAIGQNVTAAGVCQLDVDGRCASRATPSPACPRRPLAPARSSMSATRAAAPSSPSPTAPPGGASPTGW